MKKRRTDSREKIIQNNLNTGTSQFTVKDNTEMFFEGCREITEYTENKITLDTGRLKVSLCGNNLIIKNYGEKTAEICGEFGEISFE